jgi:hypothetical protein
MFGPCVSFSLMINVFDSWIAKDFVTA